MPNEFRGIFSTMTATQNFEEVNPRTRSSLPRKNLLVMMTIVCLSTTVISIMARSSMSWNSSSIYDLTYLVGPAVKSLGSGRGLLVCTEDMGTPGNPICFRGARMPVAPVALALMVECLGNRPKLINLCKDLIFLIPLWIAAALVLFKLQLGSGGVMVCGALLMIPFLIYDYVGVARTLEIQEGYFYGLIALAFSLLFFAFSAGPAWYLAFARTLDLIYLSKSSMLAAVFILLMAALLRLPAWRSRAILMFLVLLAPLGWGSYQRHASGHFSLGTSLDGLNFHKGNNSEFLHRYPPRLYVFDRYDWELNRGQHFNDEWTFNDYHLAQGRMFVESHPRYTAESFRQKLDLLLLTINRYGPVSPSRTMRNLAQSGTVVFRLLFWTSLLLASWAAATGRGIGRFSGLTYLLVVGAFCLPYLVGFGYMRHVIVLAYPAAIVCCLALKTYSTTRPCEMNPVGRYSPSADFALQPLASLSAS